MSSLENFNGSGIQVVSPNPSGEGGLAINNNFKALALRRRLVPDNVTVVAFSIPSIDPLTHPRQVVTVVLGQLVNPNAAVLAFFPSSTSTADIQAFRCDNTGFLYTSQKICCAGDLPASSYFASSLPALGTSVMSQRVIVVTTDYTKATRCIPPWSGSEVAGAGGTALNSNGYNYSYSSLNVAALFGYYSSTSLGVFLLNRKIEMESAWLTQSGSDTVLNMAFYNRDSTGNTALSLKVGVYE